MGNTSSKPMFNLKNFVLKGMKKREIVSIQIDNYFFGATDMIHVELNDSIVPINIGKNVKIRPTTEVTIKYIKKEKGGKKNYYTVTTTVSIDSGLYHTYVAGMKLSFRGIYIFH